MSDPSRYLVELRAEVAGNALRGHAAVFDQIAQLPGHYERLAPTAFKRALDAPTTDVRALLNHDPNLLLGRQAAGTLRLSSDSRGLAFEVDLPNTTYANDLRELVARGDLTGASFAFVPDEDEWDRAPDGRQMRTHTSVAQLIDISPVTFPAYSGASVSLRHMEFNETGQSGRSQLVRARARVHLKG